jgi:hypothetical protein
MQFFRTRAGLLTRVVLSWQIVVLLTMTAAARCKSDASAPIADRMASCPMHQPVRSSSDPICRTRTPATDHNDCACPKVARAETTAGFTALLGPVGVLPTIAEATGLTIVGNAVMLPTSVDSLLAPDPSAPPPRA